MRNKPGLEEDNDKLFPRTAEEWLAAFAPPEYTTVLNLLCALPSVKKNIEIAEREGTEIAYKGGLLVGFHIGTNYVRTGKLEDV